MAPLGEGAGRTRGMRGLQGRHRRQGLPRYRRRVWGERFSPFPITYWMFHPDTRSDTPQVLRRCAMSDLAFAVPDAGTHEDIQAPEVGTVHAGDQVGEVHVIACTDR